MCMIGLGKSFSDPSLQTMMRVFSESRRRFNTTFIELSWGTAGLAIPMIGLGMIYSWLLTFLIPTLICVILVIST
eukprot:UN16953